jgi:diguanylate cyclase (GGDEF)-like protein
MYDPLIVDTFIATHQDLAPQANQSDDHREAISTLSADLHKTEKFGSGSGLDDIAASSEEMLTLFDLARSLGRYKTFVDAAEATAQHIRRVVPSSTCVFYTYDATSDELVVAHAAGEHSGQFSGLRVPRGQRLSGWVAANRRTILNSDPVLELGEMARSLKPRLYSCLSTPVVHDEVLLGVLTLYAGQRDAFTEDHRRISENVARQFGSALRQMSQADSAMAPTSEHHSTIPTRDFSFTSGARDHIQSSGFSIILLQFTKLRGGREGDEPQEVTVAQLTTVIRNALRNSDVLVRYSETELVALLDQTKSDAATQTAQRIATHIKELRHTSRDRGLATLAFFVGAASAPFDGTNIDKLVGAARRRSQPLDRAAQGPTSIH